MLSNYYYQNINDYYKVFRAAEKSAEYDITTFVEFVCKGHITCASELKTTIIYFIRRLSLADYFKYCRKSKAIGDRQYRFLELLLDHQKEFTLSDLFHTSPFSLLYRNCSERTARRDLKKLADAQLLLTREGGKYTLNIKALD
jgi:Fic family protein